MTRKRGGPTPLTQEQALSRVISVHGDKYDFSVFKYTRANTKVDAICYKHGPFSIRYSDLVGGSGCIKCGNDSKIAKLTTSFEDFLVSARKHHGDKYEYIEDTYKGNNRKVGIICKQHGLFYQIAGRHSTVGCGCPKCQINGFNRGKIGHLYFLTNGEYLKIGVTNRKVTTRLKEINKTVKDMNPFSVVTSFIGDGEYVYDVEQYLLSIFDEHRIKDILFSGSTETFSSVIFEELMAAVVSYKMLAPKIGSVVKTIKVRKSMTPFQIKEKRRKAVLAKTGVPVGIIPKDNCWVFQETRRDESGIKYKKHLGKFIDKQDAIDFATYYYENGELLDTRKNLLVYNSKGYLYGIKLRQSKFETVVNWSTPSKERKREYLGLFKTLEEAEQTLKDFKVRLENGEFGPIHRSKY